MSSAWRQMDVLLTCDLCSEHFKNPKQLPCQHTYCMEPCLERLVEHNQLRCPECGTDFRVPFQGLNAFPNNVTLVRFLELRQSVQGEEPEPPPSLLQCAVCKERGPHQKCAHCDKKVCKECKKAHSKILRKELMLVVDEVKNGVNDLREIFEQTKQNVQKLQQNCKSVKSEIDEISQNYINDLLKTEQKLKYELEQYLTVELKNMNNLRKALEIEVANMNSNCDLIDKHMNENVPWTDKELVEYKDMFQRTLEFLRYFDTDPSDYGRRIRFHPHVDTDVLHKTLIDFGEVTLNDSQAPSPEPPYFIYNPNVPRSQSDHRLIAQLQRQQEAKRSLNEGEKDMSHPPKKFVNFALEADGSEKEVRFSSDEQGHMTPWKRDQESEGLAHRLRFTHNVTDEDTNDIEVIAPPPRRAVKIEDYAYQSKKVKETEDATKGPLSGVYKLNDSPKVMERLHENEVKQKLLQQEAERKANEPPPSMPPPPAPPQRVSRQVSEDEIDKQKKQNKAAAAAAATATPTLPKEETPSTGPPSTQDKPPRPPIYDSPSFRRTFELETRREEANDSPSRLRSWRAAEADVSDVNSPKDKPPVAPRNLTQPINKNARGSLPKPVDQEERGSREEPIPPRRVTYLSRTGSIERPESERPAEGYKPAHSFSSRFLDRIRARREEEKESESSKSSSESSESDTEDEVVTSRTKEDISPSVNALLARSAQARRDSARSHNLLLQNREEGKRSRSWKDSSTKEEDVSKATSRSQDSSALNGRLGERRRNFLSDEKNSEKADLGKKYKSSSMARSKSTHEILHAADDSQDEDRPTSPYWRSRYGQSRSSRHEENGDDEDRNSSWSNYLKSKYGSRNRRSRNQSDSDDSDDEDKSRYQGREQVTYPRRTYIQKGKVALKFGTRGSEPGCFTWPRGVASGPDSTIAVADSSNHRVQVFTGTGKFLHEFGSYGSGEGEFDCLAAVAVNRIGQYIVSDRYNHRIQVFDASGRFVRTFGSEGRADGKFNYPWGLATDNLGFIYICDKENHRIQVFQSDGVFVSKFGQVGSRPGCFEHPHYVAVSTTNRVIVSDSNNHRVQIFDVNGRLLSTFGSEGSDEGQFKFPRGVAVDDQGFIIVGDSGNNRIQIFHPDGTFLKSFGSWGPGEGQFKGLEGVAVTPAGNILVCDRENHRIQVF